MTNYTYNQIAMAIFKTACLFLLTLSLPLGQALARPDCIMDRDGDGISSRYDFDDQNAEDLSIKAEFDADDDGFVDTPYATLDVDNDGYVSEEEAVGEERWLYDSCVGASNAAQDGSQPSLSTECLDFCEDADDDGVCDTLDVCVNEYDPSQRDSDQDGRGDACDLDKDGDGRRNSLDNCPDVPNPGQMDSDDDGAGDLCDGHVPANNQYKEDKDEMEVCPVRNLYDPENIKEPADARDPALRPYDKKDPADEQKEPRDPNLEDKEVV